jgi:aminopeptidase N
MPRSREPRRVTWMEVAVRNAGLRKGQTALVWALSWAVTRESLGRDPSAEEVAAWWKESVRTAYREQSAFREAFPTLDSPAKIFENPAVRAKVTKVARAGDELQAQKKARRPIPDLTILELGLSTATI